MKDLKKLAAECEADLLSIGIQPGKINRWIVNTRAKYRWGQCKEYLPGLFDISIAERLLQDNVSDQATKNTILHELLHTVKGCHGHKGKWKELATKLTGVYLNTPSREQPVVRKMVWNLSPGNARTVML